jgi:predicted porin
MKRTLIATAALMSLAGAAQAQLSIYGLIDLSYGQNIFDDINGTNANFHSGGDDFSTQGNSTTRVGLKGSAEVGAGVKANFQLETAGITSDGRVGSGDQPFFNRQMWAGLSSAYGEVRLGRQDSVAWQTMSQFDFNGASNSASALTNSLVAPYLPPRQSRSLQYISPDFSGFKAQVGFTPEGNDDGDKANYSLSLNYNAGPFAIGATTESKRKEFGRNFNAVAASYDFGFVKVMASYADGGEASGFNSDGSFSIGTGKGFGVGAVAPIAGFNVGFHYGDNSDDNIKTNALELFINREIFKNTYAYLDYGHVTDFPVAVDTGEGGITINRKSATAFALGIIYTF